MSVVRASARGRATPTGSSKASVDGAAPLGGNLAKALAVSVMVFIGTTGLAYALKDTTENWQVPLYVGAGLSALFLWKGVSREEVWDRYFSFGSGLLLICALNRVLYLGDFFFSGPRFSESPVFTTDGPDALIWGEVATVLGCFLTASTWILAGGQTFSANRIFLAERGMLTRSLIITYAASLVGVVALGQSQSVLGIGQLIPELSGLGSVVALVLPRLVSQRSSNQIMLALVLSVPFVGYALGTGMKGSMILSLLPVGFYLWRAASTTAARIAIVISAAITIGLITAYVGYYRDEVWVRQRSGDTVAVLQDFAEELSTNPTGALAASSKRFLARANASVHRAWAVSLADVRGYQPELVFAPLAYVFIPRFVWPEKPAIRQGWEYQRMLFGSNNESSVAAGFYTSLYLGGGWLPVVAGAGAIGWLVATLGRFANYLGGPILTGLFGFAMIPFALRLDDSWSVGALSGPIVEFAYIAAIYLVTRVLTGMLERRTE